MNFIYDQGEYVFYVTRIEALPNVLIVQLFIDGDMELWENIPTDDKKNIRAFFQSLGIDTKDKDIKSLCPLALNKSGGCEIGISSHVQPSGKTCYKNEILKFNPKS